MNYLLVVFAILIAVLGFMGARYYENSSNPAKEQRIRFCYFSAYVFGIAPLLFMLANMGADMLAKRSPTMVMRARMHFGLYSFMAIFTIALASMLINDLRDDESRATTYKAHYGMSLFILIISILLFIYAGTVITMPEKYMSKLDQVTGFESGPMTGFGSYDDLYPHMFGFGRRRNARK